MEFGNDRTENTMTTTLVGTPDPDDFGEWPWPKRPERLNWLVRTLADHVARIKWLIQAAREAEADKRIVWELEASLDLATAASAHLGDQIRNATVT